MNAAGVIHHLALGPDSVPLGELGLRVVIAGALGALVGLDRELSDQAAGLRTHILVSLGAALFTLTGAYVFSGANVDPTRIAAQVVTGIGFLGAGAIIRQGFTVRGLTTAAGLWVTAAIGTAVALGFYYGAVVTTAAAVISLFVFKRIERKLLRGLKPGRFEFVVTGGDDLKFSEVYEILESKKIRIDSVNTEKHEEGRHHVNLQLRLPGRVSPQDVAEVLLTIAGIDDVDWRR